MKPNPEHANKKTNHNLLTGPFIGEFSTVRREYKSIPSPLNGCRHDLLALRQYPHHLRLAVPRRRNRRRIRTTHCDPITEAQSSSLATLITAVSN